MSDQQFFLFSFIVFFLMESVFWVENGALIFLSTPGKGYKVKTAGIFLTNKKGGFVLANPVPPLGQGFLARPLPFSFNRDGIVAMTPCPLLGTTVLAGKSISLKWDDIQNFSLKDETLLLNGRPFVSSKSRVLLKQSLKIVRGLREAPLEKRETLIKQYLEESLNIEGLTDKKNIYYSKTMAFRIFSNLLWFYIFLFSPGIIMYMGFIPVIIYLLGGYLFLHVTSVILFMITHKKLKSGIPCYDFLAHIFKITVFPPALIRALDIYSSDYFTVYHPLAIAFVFLPDRTLDIFIRKYLLALSYFKPGSRLNGKAGNIVKDFNQMQKEVLENFVQNRGKDLKHLLSPDFSGDTHALSICPRCHSEYTLDSGFCTDCTDVALEPITSFTEEKDE